MSFEIIGLIYFGEGDGLSHRVQTGFEITFACWHFLLLISAILLLLWSNKYRPNKLTKLVYTIIILHCLAKTISDILFINLLTNTVGNVFDASVAFEAFEICGIITYYCMYGIVLFSWIEVVFRVEHLGHGEEKVRLWRNVFCVFTSMWIIAIFIISELFVNIDQKFAIMVFGIGLAIISCFSFALSIAFIVYWIKLHRMVTSLQIASSTKRRNFLVKVGVVTVVFILCLDAKIAHYFINIKSPFVSNIWDLYALNYLPEAIAVTVSLIFFGSNMGSVDDNFSGKASQYYSDTEKANIRRREEKQGLLSTYSNSSQTYSVQ